ncbi:MAG: Eco29kI family restriction endonuclease [Chloroflexota bacterium]
MALPPASVFVGGGVYTLYYVGGFTHYKKLSARNHLECRQPIYVGKAVPVGWRTARVQSATAPVLYRRLKEHANSIRQTENLKLEDFKCRFMILDQLEGDLVVPVEAELIRRQRPLWNTVVDGFGNHDPGSGRYNQALSEWDVLHPGRAWTKRLTGQSPKLEQVLAKVARQLT